MILLTIFSKILCLRTLLLVEKQYPNIFMAKKDWLTDGVSFDTAVVKSDKLCKLKMCESGALENVLIPCNTG